MPWTDVREDREQYKFRNIDNETVVAVTEVLNNTGNAINVTKTTVTSIATQILMPEGINQYSIFHQTTGGILYYNEDNSVGATDPQLKTNDVLNVTGVKDFEIWMKSSAGDITVFVTSITKA